MMPSETLRPGKIRTRKTVTEKLTYAHPEAMDGHGAVFIGETSNFPQGQGNQALAE
jgi:hypothetical protein